MVLFSTPLFTAANPLSLSLTDTRRMAVRPARFSTAAAGTVTVTVRLSLLP
jgi:hypothetical protein